MNDSHVNPIDVDDKNDKFTCYRHQQRVCKSLVQHLRQVP